MPDARTFEALLQFHGRPMAQWYRGRIACSVPPRPLWRQRFGSLSQRVVSIEAQGVGRARPARRVRSVNLLEVARAAGFQATSTVLSTGNLLGEAAGSQRLVERRLERATETVLGKRIAVFCRSAVDFKRLVNEPPFSQRALRLADPTQVAVRIMRVAPSPEVIERIASHCELGDQFRARDDALWMMITRRPFSEARLARAVNAAWAGEGTSRSLSALVKIAAALERIHKDGDAAR